MSAIGFLGSAALEALLSRSTQTGTDKFKQAFQQLGQDLKAGNIAKAETDLATLQSNTAPTETPAASVGSISQAFNQITQDLQAGNLTAAQSDYATLQQDLQQGFQSHRHHMHMGSQANLSQMQQLFTQLGHALRSGKLSAAQQAYATLQADLPSFMSSSSASNSTATASAGSAVNVSV
jgi:hypothetical protein